MNDRSGCSSDNKVTMGTGIGILCRRCGQQLNDDDGFDRDAQLCNRCSSVTRYYCRYSTDINSFDTSNFIDEIKQRVDVYFAPIEQCFRLILNALSAETEQCFR